MGREAVKLPTQCIGQHPTTKNYPAQNINSAKLEITPIMHTKYICSQSQSPLI